MKLMIYILRLLSACSFESKNFSYTGNLTNDDSVQLFNLSIKEASTVSIRTWSYAGGKNAHGELIPAGGFDPILTIFDADGNYLDESHDIDTDNEEYDALLSKDLVAGNYIVALTQYPNAAVLTTLKNAFIEGSGESKFNGRNNQWALDIKNVNTATTVSLSAALKLFGAALLCSF